MQPPVFALGWGPVIALRLMNCFPARVYAGFLGVIVVMAGCGEGDIRGGVQAGGAGGQGSGGSGQASGGIAGVSNGGNSNGGSSSGAASSGGASSGGASGSSSGGSPASGGSAGADPCANTLVCDDFEDYDVGGDPGGSWVLDENNGSVTVDDARATSGDKSVRFDTEAGDYKSALIAIEGAPFPLSGNGFFGRMMVYMTAAANDGVHWSMILGDGPDMLRGNDLASVRYGGQHEKRLMGNYWSEPNTSDCWHHSQATTMPEGRWACMEWQFDGPSETLRFWLDKEPIDDLTLVGVSDTERGDGCNPNATENHWYFPTFERVAVGWQSYQTDEARELWIDDVALGLERIGCPQ